MEPQARGNARLAAVQRLLVVFAAGALAAGCAVRHPAPVVERMPSAAQAAKPAPAPVAAPVTAPAPVRAPEVRPEFYTVRRGDTLYGIALDQGLEYREIAEWNNLSDPHQIRAGQVLSLRPPQPGAAAASVAQVSPIAIGEKLESRPLAAAPQSTVIAGEPKSPAAAESRTPTGVAETTAPAAVTGTMTPLPGAAAVKTEPRAYKLPYSAENVALMSRGETPRSEPRIEPKPEFKPEPRGPAAKPQGEEEDTVDWGWPSAGRVLAGFSEPANKGVDVGGKIGDPVFASASGRVVYSGTGLRGYGKLVIIKHNKTFLSAYAHNHQILVKEGQQVIKGQKIAEIGDSDTDGPRLHFEIRRLGKPVDPLKYLPERQS